MSYVQHVLQPGEQLRQISSIHWIGYWPGVAVALLAVVAYGSAEHGFCREFGGMRHTPSRSVQSFS